MTQALTTAQAAFVVGTPLGTFKKTVEKAPVKWRVMVHGGRRVRQFKFADLVFLHAYGQLRKEFTPKSQTDFYRALCKARPVANLPHEIAFGSLKYDIRRHLQAVEDKLKELDKVRSEIEKSNGEAFIKGTQIEAHRIAALLNGGMTVQEVLRDYPSLEERQVLAAKSYAQSNPKRGRPYPKRTAKAAMRSANLGALDDDD